MTTKFGGLKREGSTENKLTCIPYGLIYSGMNLPQSLVIPQCKKLNNNKCTDGPDHPFNALHCYVTQMLSSLNCNAQLCSWYLVPTDSQEIGSQQRISSGFNQRDISFGSKENFSNLVALGFEQIS